MYYVGAPELRRRKQVGSSSSDESDDKGAHDDDDSSIDGKQTVGDDDDDNDEEDDETKSRKKGFQTLVTHEDDSECDKPVSSDNHDGSIVIRPMMRLMPHRTPVEDIPLDHLSAEDRDMYLRDFLPPCPPIRKRRKETESKSCNPIGQSPRHRFSWPVFA